MATKASEQLAGSRYNYLPSYLKASFLVLSAVGLAVIVFYIFGFTIGGKALINVNYYYLLYAFYSSSVFLLLPARKGENKPRWYDLVAAVATFSLGIYFFSNAWEILQVGWIPPSSLNFALGLAFCVLILEGCRRSGGPVYFIVCIAVGIYPLFAFHMPGPFFGISYSFVDLVGMHVFGGEGLIGIPAKVLGELLIGFLIFAGILIASGAGEFFLKLSMALLGKYRGGPAKVAVMSSAFFGSLSGSALSNVVSTGPVTIPAMKRIGYPPHYAGAIEACASSGGVLMPPIMGAVAFVMCVFLTIDYSAVVVAAIIPSVLYYFGLLLQVDSYAARVGLKGLPLNEIPSLRKTLKDGWQFIAVLVFLVWGLVFMRWAAMAPFYGSALMIILACLRRETFMTPRRILQALARVGVLITQSVAIIAPIGFVINGLTITGVASALTSALVNLAGGSLVTILIMAALACYLLGMGGMLVAAYVFLAVSMAPAVIKAGQLNELAVHLFIIYYAMLSTITPPVAVAAFLGATIASAQPMKTAFLSMRLGFVKYIVPFFFILNPSLILQGSIIETLYLFALCLLGIWLMAAGLDGYLLKIGPVGFIGRPFLVVGGFLIAYPEWKTTIVGTAISLLGIGILLIKKQKPNEA